MNNDEYLIKKCYERLAGLDPSSVEYDNRLLRELEVIKDKGFSSYFNIVADVIDWARSKGILIGLARGSAAGSLVSYLLGITQIDPIKYELLFERFLDPSRLEFPDIDLDVQKSRRGEIIDYIKEKYSEERVCHIINFNRFQAKNVTKDVSRIFGVPFQEVNKVTRLIEKDMSLKEAMEILEIKKFYNKYPDLEEIAYALENAVRGPSTHAAGILITKGKISDYITTEKVKGTLNSCFDKGQVEDLGLLKLDLLGLRTLDVVAETLSLINEEIELPMEFNDPKVFELFQNGDTAFTFQFDTLLLTKMAREMQIDSFEKICGATAAVRPGAQNSGSAKRYIDKLLGKKPITYLHESLKPYLSETLGEILYQEQCMLIAHNIGKMDLTRAYRMIKAISKSKGVDVINEYRDEFVTGCDFDKSIANKIWDVIKESGAYSFNKSHAVGYSALTYWTAWLKTYYPKEFLIATIHYPKDGKKEEKREMVIQAIRELRKNGYEVRPPNINVSGESISIGDTGIYMGLSDVAGVGKEAVKEILLYQPYGSFDEFVGKVQKRKVKKNILLNLIQAGAFDKFERRDELYSRITEEPYRVWEDVEMLTRQMTVLDLPSAKPIIDYYENKYEGYVNITLIEDIDPNVNEKEIWVRGIISDYKTRSIASKLSESLGIEKKIALFTVDDGTKRLECSVPPEIYTFSKELLNDGEPVVLKGHTYNSRLYVDGILNLTQNNDEILEKYIYTHGREKEIEDLESQPGHNNVSVIVSLNYRLSKNGNQYVQIHDQDGERLMWFGRGQAFKNLKPGKIIVWNKSDDSKPFINMEKVIS